jgi:hypothetical protein
MDGVALVLMVILSIGSAIFAVGDLALLLRPLRGLRHRPR